MRGSVRIHRQQDQQDFLHEKTPFLWVELKSKLQTHLHTIGLIGAVASAQLCATPRLRPFGHDANVFDGHPYRTDSDGSKCASVKVAEKHLIPTNTNAKRTIAARLNVTLRTHPFGDALFDIKLVVLSVSQ